MAYILNFWKFYYLGIVGNSAGGQSAVGRGFETLGVGPVRCHRGMECGTARLETSFLSLVAPQDEAHELAHAISWNEVGSLVMVSPAILAVI